MLGGCVHVGSLALTLLRLLEYAGQSVPHFMKAYPIRSKRLLASGFTLIELLVVITIIAVLAGLAMPAINGAMKNAKKVRTQAALKDLVLGVKNYQVEYNRYPTAGNSKSETPMALEQGNQVLQVLLGENPNRMNPRKQAFIEPPMGKNNVGGLVGSSGNYGLMDFWGQPYYMVMDLNYDNKIANPDARNDDQGVARGASPQLPMGAIAFSYGEDKKENTKDDVVSWR
jgi:prepilin-type N-terminal cleavage/methylation domain-containing protein